MHDIYDTAVAEHAKDALREYGCLLENGHFRLKSKKDSTVYVNHRDLLDSKNRLKAEKYLELLTQRVRRITCDYIVGPEFGGKVMAEILAEQVSGLTSRPTVRAQWISKDETSKVYFLTDACANTVKGRRILFVDDVYTTGGTAEEGINLIRQAGGIVVAVAVSWNRGGGRAEDLGVEKFISLIEEPIPDFAPGASTCPGCKAGTPYHPTLGHKHGPITK